MTRVVMVMVVVCGGGGGGGGSCKRVKIEIEEASQTSAQCVVGSSTASTGGSEEGFRGRG